MIATPQRTRKLFHAGRIAPRRCSHRVHIGPLRPNPRMAGWLGYAWADCTVCGSTITTHPTPEVAA